MESISLAFTSGKDNSGSGSDSSFDIVSGGIESCSFDSQDSSFERQILPTANHPANHIFMTNITASNDLVNNNIDEDGDRILLLDSWNGKNGLLHKSTSCLNLILQGNPIADIIVRNCAGARDDDLAISGSDDISKSKDIIEKNVLFSIDDHSLPDSNRDSYDSYPSDPRGDEGLLLNQIAPPNSQCYESSEKDSLESPPDNTFIQELSNRLNLLEMQVKQMGEKKSESNPRKRDNCGICEYLAQLLEISVIRIIEKVEQTVSCYLDWISYLFFMLV